MNLDDLRQELSTRADEAGHPDLLAGVHHRIRRTKQRRVATALTATAAVAALAIGLVPTALTTTKDPDPSKTTDNQEPPADYTRADVTLPGSFDGDPLEKPWIGDVGQNRLRFNWSPSTTDIVLTPYCSSKGGDHNVEVLFNDILVTDYPCSDMGGMVSAIDEILPTSDIWSLIGDPKKPIEVTVQLVSGKGTLVKDPTAQLALGIYRNGPSTQDSMPTRAVPDQPDDYIRDGVRYRANVAGETLEAAMVGALGQKEISLTWTPSTTNIDILDFCTLAADRGTSSIVILNGKQVGGSDCRGDKPRDHPTNWLYLDNPEQNKLIRLGVPNTLTMRLDSAGKTITADAERTARLGLAIYRRGASRAVGDGKDIRLAERIEYAGYEYELADVRTGKATKNAAVSTTSPADKAFLVVAGGFGQTFVESDRQPRKMTLTGAGREPQEFVESGSDLPTAGLVTVAAQSARPLTATIGGPPPNGGGIYLAVYVPVG